MRQKSTGPLSATNVVTSLSHGHNLAVWKSCMTYRDGIPEFFASQIERCEDNGDGTCRLWFVADRVTEDVGARRVTEAVVRWP